MSQEKRPTNNSGHQQYGYQPSSIKKGLQPQANVNPGRPPSSGSSVQRPNNK